MSVGDFWCVIPDSQWSMRQSQHSHLASSFQAKAKIGMGRPDWAFCRTCTGMRIRYCLITVPSRSLISPQPPFKGLAVNGDFATSFSSISIPHPGFSLIHK